MVAKRRLPIAEVMGTNSEVRGKSRLGGLKETLCRS